MRQSHPHTTDAKVKGSVYNVGHSSETKLNLILILYMIRPISRYYLWGIPAYKLLAFCWARFSKDSLKRRFPAFLLPASMSSTGSLIASWCTTGVCRSIGIGTVSWRNQLVKLDCSESNKSVSNLPLNWVLEVATLQHQGTGQCHFALQIMTKKCKHMKVSTTDQRGRCTLFLT